jgi:hypothetical protein
VALRVGEAERRAPRGAEHEPALDPEVLAQRLDVGEEVVRRVGAQLAERLAAAAAALVEEHDPVAREVERLEPERRAAGSRAAVEDHRGASLAVDLPVDPVAVADVQQGQTPASSTA